MEEVGSPHLPHPAWQQSLGCSISELWCPQQTHTGSTSSGGSLCLTGSVVWAPIPLPVQCMLGESHSSHQPPPDCKLAPTICTAGPQGHFAGCPGLGCAQEAPLCSLPRAGQPCSAPNGCSPSGFAGDGERMVRGAVPTAQPRLHQQAPSSGEPKPAPPGPSPPQHRSPVAQRSSSASPCPAPSACEHQPSGPFARPCPGGAAVSSAPQHGVPAPPQPSNGGLGWRKELGEGEGPRLPSAPRQVCKGAPAGSGFGDRVAMALGCHGLSPLCLPAAPALQPDPGGFSGSRSDPAGKADTEL